MKEGHRGTLANKMSTFTALVLLLAVTAPIPTSSATNHLRKLLSINDGDPSAPDQPSVGDFPVTRDVETTSVSMPLDTFIQSFQQLYQKESLMVSTTSLTGYLITVGYDDAGCTKLRTAVAAILNTCTAEEVSSDRYSKLTATATDYVTTYYSDRECTKVTDTTLSTTYSSGCTGYRQTYINTDGVVTSSSAMAVISRYIAVSITFACHSHQSSSCCFLRQLIKSRLKPYENTCDLANVARLKCLTTLLQPWRWCRNLHRNPQYHFI